MNRNLKWVFGSFIMAAVLMACDKMEDTYEDFIKDGEIYYPGKAQSLTAAPGQNRIQLSWLLVSDPKITKTAVYWNNKADSVVIPVTRTTGVDTIRTTISPIAEGTYTFEVYTYDAKGNRSVKVDIISNVYGNNYSITLVNRALKSAVMSTGTIKDTAKLEWYPKSIGLVGVDLRYKNTLGDSVFVFVPADAPRTSLLKFVKGSSFKYRSLYKPEENALDTFYTPYELQQVN